MSKYNVVDNTELVELIERGLRIGHWDKALIPELKKRFKEIEKQEKLLELYKKIYNGCTDYHDYEELKELQKQIKELENETIYI